MNRPRSSEGNTPRVAASPNDLFDAAGLEQARFQHGGDGCDDEGMDQFLAHHAKRGDQEAET